MRLCPVKDLEDDMVLGKSIYLMNGKLLLGAGFSISPEMKGKLVERGYTHIYIMEEGTDDVVPQDLIPDEVSHQAKITLANKIYDIQNQTEFKNVTVSRATELIESGCLSNVNMTNDVKKIIEEIIKDISMLGSNLLNSVMIKTVDTYFLDHSVNTTVLSILIGRKYKFSQKELTSLGLGVFLHDVGKTITEKMNEDNDPAKAKELYLEHPTFSHLILNNSPNMSPIETQIAKQHHENQDGTGFPIGLKGRNQPPVKNLDQPMKGFIFRLAEICRVTDAFDNITYNPIKREQTNPAQAIKKIILKAGTKFNKDVVKTLLTVVPYYPVGATVKVVDVDDSALEGYTGVVARVVEDNINKPGIILIKDRHKKKIKPMVIDTSKFKKVELKLMI
jgi:HD-GYP domain-containing protein (c-di-GMP phosphodiesterase class II)